MTTRPLKPRLAGQRIKQPTPLVLALEEKNQEATSRMVDNDIQQIIDDILEDDQSIELTVFDGIKQYIKRHADGVSFWTQERKPRRAQEDPAGRAEDVYRRMTKRIANSVHPEAIQQGRKILACSVFSRRRLTVEETADAILVPTLSEAAEFEPSPAVFKNRVRLLQR
ncbi:hypothetical protein F4801DRAFT_124775 [Xylaria longipes]|nr:hypothetical protein F4801DRAFT_124775 [Xylaria longipes]